MAPSNFPAGYSLWHYFDPASGYRAWITGPLSNECAGGGWGPAINAGVTSSSLAVLDATAWSDPTVSVRCGVAGVSASPTLGGG